MLGFIHELRGCESLKCKNEVGRLTLGGVCPAACSCLEYYELKMVEYPVDSTGVAEYHFKKRFRRNLNEG